MTVWAQQSLLHTHEEGPGKPHLPFELLGKAGGCARVTAGPKRPHLGLGPGRNVPLQGRQGYRGRIPVSPGGPQLSLETRMEDWTSLGQHKRKPEFPVVTRESLRTLRKTT